MKPLLNRERFDTWRAFPSPILHSLSCGGPEVIPLTTNGVIFEGRTMTGDYFIGHVANLVVPKADKEAKAPKVVKKAKTSPKPTKLSREDILALLAEL